jgi:3-mercaptopyruvate sulfurtransferase SseA/sterol desaturase/sphingolipid hydroxylase (fatty acid hydroxylase superfamily)
MKRFFYIPLITLLFAFSSFGQSSTETIITADQLEENFQDYKIIDVSDTEAFDTAHILGAKNIWRPGFTSTSSEVSGMVPSMNEMEASLIKLELTHQDRIVLYDHKGGCDAARLYFILDYYGHENLYLLDGGLRSWGDKNNNVVLNEQLINIANYAFTKGTLDNRIATKEDVKNAIDSEEYIIVDTRTLEEYEGAKQKDGASAAGRIPGAVHIDWIANINFEGDHKLKSKEELQGIYNYKGVTTDKKVIVYCHSGARSAHNYYVLTELLGYENVQNYDGSWIEWSADSTLPIEKGSVSELEYTSYSEIFGNTFSGYYDYIWNQITFQANPWYENYFWFLVILSFVVWMLEIAFPWRKNQAIFRKDFWLDFFFMFFNFYIFNLIIFLAFSKFVTKGFYDMSGVDLTNTSVFDMSALPWGVQMLIFFLATDFIQWVTHVALHRFNFLWRFHKVHHSVEQMGFAAHLRYHWMETIFYTPMKFIAVMFIGGFAPEQAFIIYFFTIAIGHINHANLNISYGPLKYILNNPKMHIWHHAKELPHERRYGVNFGITLSIWDYIFKKNYIPESGRDIPLGFNDMDKYPKGFFGLILSGFRKKN